jgi:hypothetical protein
MPIVAGFDQLASVPEEQITEKIGRRVISGKQGTLVYWRMTAGRTPPLTSIHMSSSFG